MRRLSSAKGRQPFASFSVMPYTEANSLLFAVGSTSHNAGISLALAFIHVFRSFPRLAKPCDVTNTLKIKVLLIHTAC